MADVVTLDLLYKLLHVDPDSPPRDLVRAARKVSDGLPQLVISVAAREGHTPGTGSADELRRARRKAATYREIYQDLARVVEIGMLKGLSIAAHYPADVFRPVGDLDLYVADEETMWRAVKALQQRQVVDYLGIGLVGSAPTYHTALLTWPGPDSMLDRDHEVEIYTGALPGNFAAVPVRARPPADQYVANLLAIAEERFEREFNAKDLLDVLVIAGVEDADVATLIAAASEYHCAPELVELLDRAGGYGSIGPLVEAAAALREPAERELARRAGWRPPEPSAGLPPMLHRLATGKPVYGLHLRSVPDRTGWAQSVPYPFDGGVLLLTPVADYLLVGVEVVARDEYERALRELERVDCSSQDALAAGGVPA